MAICMQTFDIHRWGRLGAMAERAKDPVMDADLISSPMQRSFYFPRCRYRHARLAWLAPHVRMVPGRRQRHESCMDKARCLYVFKGAGARISHSNTIDEI